MDRPLRKTPRHSRRTVERRHMDGWSATQCYCNSIRTVLPTPTIRIRTERFFDATARSTTDGLYACGWCWQQCWRWIQYAFNYLSTRKHIYGSVRTPHNADLWTTHWFATTGRPIPPTVSATTQPSICS